MYTKETKPKGRPRGSKNKASVAGREFARRILEDPVYRKTLLTRAKAGILPPAVEAMLWAYAYSKPPLPQGHRSSQDINVNLTNLTNDQLESKITELTKEVREITVSPTGRESDGQRDEKPSRLN